MQQGQEAMTRNLLQVDKKVTGFEMPGFADIKPGSNIHELLNKIIFVTSEMNDPSE